MKKFYYYLKEIGIPNLIVMFAVGFYSIYRIFAAETIIGSIVATTHLIAVVFALIYAFKVYSKESTKFYRIFMWIFLGCALLNCVTTFLLGTFSVVTLIIGIVAAAIILYLIISKDLGKDKSTMISIALCFVYVFQIFAALFLSDNSTPALFNSIDNLLLAVVSYLVVDGKYFNKESRGTD